MSGLIKLLRGGVFAALGLYIALRITKLLRKVQFQRLKGRIKREQRDRTPLPRLKSLAPFLEQKILACSASELAQKIRTKEFSCEEVVTCYIRRAYNIGRSLNLIAEEAYLPALETAKKFDRALAKGKPPKGILYGVPISVKDHIAMKGACTSCGITNACDIPDMEDAVVLQLLKEQGAIPFVRSNVPQALAWIETDNYIYGRSLNPWDTSRSTGGSSGGEGGLIASRASPLGIGTDSAGSIRVPCAFCGVYGYKPTAERVSELGIYSPLPHRHSPFGHLKMSVVGPMGRSVEDLILFMKSIWTPKHFEYDKIVPPLVFNEELFQSTLKRKLRIGYYINDGQFECCPSVERSIRETVKKLSEAGHEVVEFQLPNFRELLENIISLLSSDNWKFLEDMLQGEPAKWYFRPGLVARHFVFFKSVTTSILEFLGEYRIGHLLKLTGEKTADKTMKNFNYKEKYAEELIEKWMQEDIDVLLCPTWPLPAIKHKFSLKLFIANNYALLFNLLRLPAGIIPVSEVFPEECRYSSVWKDAATSTSQQNMLNAEGLPVTIQLVGLPFRDELTLAAMKVVEDLCGTHKFAS